MRNLFLLVILFLSLSSISQTKIFGKIKHSSTTPLFLMENIGGNYAIIDSCSINTGVFSFEKKLQTGYYALGLNDNNFAQIIIPSNEENIEINFSGDHLKRDIKVIQSNENRLLWDFMVQRKKMKSEISQVYRAKTYFNENSIEYHSFQKQEDSLKRLYNNYLLTLYKKNSQTFFAKTIISDIAISENDDFFKYTFFNEPDLIRSGVFTKQITEYLQFHTAYTEDGFIGSLDIILQKAAVNHQVYEFVLNYLLELFNQVGPDVVLDYLVEEYVISNACSDLEISEILASKINAYKKLQLGNTAPNVDLFDTEGAWHQLKDIYPNSRLNVLFFGSSQCHFCQEAKPQLEGFSRNTALQKLQIIYISLDTNLQEWRKETESKIDNWVYLSELKAWNSISTEVFQVHKTPSFYIIDGNSQIMSKPKNIEELLSELEFLGIE